MKKSEQALYWLLTASMSLHRTEAIHSYLVTVKFLEICKNISSLPSLLYNGKAKHNRIIMVNLRDTIKSDIK